MKSVEFLHIVHIYDTPEYPIGMVRITNEAHIIDYTGIVKCSGSFRKCNVRTSVGPSLHDA